MRTLIFSIVWACACSVVLAQDLSIQEIDVGDYLLPKPFCIEEAVEELNFFSNNHLKQHSTILGIKVPYTPFQDDYPFQALTALRILENEQGYVNKIIIPIIFSKVSIVNGQERFVSVDQALIDSLNESFKNKYRQKDAVLSELNISIEFIFGSFAPDQNHKLPQLANPEHYKSFFHVQIRDLDDPFWAKAGFISKDVNDQIIGEPFSNLFGSSENFKDSFPQVADSVPAVFSAMLTHVSDYDEFAITLGHEATHFAFLNTDAYALYGRQSREGRNIGAKFIKNFNANARQHLNNARYLRASMYNPLEIALSLWRFGKKIDPEKWDAYVNGLACE